MDSALFSFAVINLQHRLQIFDVVFKFAEGDW